MELWGHVRSLKVPTKAFWAVRHLHNDRFSTQILTVIPVLTVAVNFRCEALRPRRSHRMIVVSRLDQ